MRPFQEAGTVNSEYVKSEIRESRGFVSDFKIT